MTAVFVLSGLSVLAACSGPTEGVERGRALWDGCVQCHGANGDGNQLLQAPAIAGLQQWYIESQLMKFKTGARGAHPGDIPGLKMRPMAMTLETETDVKAIAAFVASLPAADPPKALDGGNVEAGKAAFAVCVACHGMDGAGMKALNSPNLTSQSDWYMRAQLQKLKTGVRGGKTADVTGMQMRAIAQTLDDKKIEDVVAYIMTLPLKTPKAVQ
jgi:cytochrome c oxidase subunit 2